MVGMTFAMPVNVMAIDPIPEGMVSYWRLDEGSGETAEDWADGNDGALYPTPPGPSWTTGQVGGALEFDGYDDYVDINNGAISVSTQYSIIFWIYLKDDKFSPIIMNKNEFAIIIADYGHLFFKDYNGIAGRIKSVEKIPTNSWQHFTIVRDSSLTIYRNGQVFDHTQQGYSIMQEYDNSFRIGARFAPYPSLHLDALMDEIAIFNRALTHDEILLYYTNGLIGEGYTYVPPDQAIQNLFDDIQNEELPRRLLLTS
jgi:hypothetical protein